LLDCFIVDLTMEPCNNRAMILRSISLQNLRNYTKADFTFSSGRTIIVGPNAAGKTNLVESIFLLATGKSFRTEKEKQLIGFGKQVARIKGMIDSAGDTSDDEEMLEVVISESPKFVLQKKFLVNGVSKRRVDLPQNCL